MALDTYANLKTLVQDYLDQDDLTASIDDLVTLFESRACREIRVREMLDTIGPTAMPSNGLITLPEDYIETQLLLVFSGTVPGGSPLEWVPPEIALRSIGAQAAGHPNMWTVLGDELVIKPAPDSPTAYSYTHIYYQKIPPLVANSTNWLLTKAPDLYLYGTLMEAEPYLVNDQRIQTWSGLYERGRVSLHNVDRRGRWRPGGRARAARSSDAPRVV